MTGFRHGAVSFPLLSDTGLSSLQDIDPVMYHLLSFVEYCITKYVGDRFLREAEFCELDVKSAVGSIVALDPADYLSSAPFIFPLLAGHRSRTKFSDKTNVVRQDESVIELAYILPPMTLGQAQAMTPMLRAISSVVDSRVETARDPAYIPPNGRPNDDVWGEKFAGVMSIQVIGATWEKYAGMDNMVFHAVVFDIAVSESNQVGEPVENSPFLEGVNLEAAIDGAIVAGDAVSFPGPNIVSISPQSGPLTGGTLVTITGSGFTRGSVVIIGGVVEPTHFISSTTLTFRTPPWDGNSDAFIRVKNDNLQAASLTAAFTYS